MPKKKRAAVKKQTIKLSRDLRKILENLATHERKGAHTDTMNGDTRTLERRGLIERKIRPPTDPMWLTEPYLGWGLTSDGRAAVGLAAN